MMYSINNIGEMIRSVAQSFTGDRRSVTISLSYHPYDSKRDSLQVTIYDKKYNVDNADGETDERYCTQREIYLHEVNIEDAIQLAGIVYEVVDKVILGNDNK